MNKVESYIDSLVNDKVITINIVRFYCIGLLLFAIPYTRELFYILNPFNFILATAVIFWKHNQSRVKLAIFFAIIGISSFVIESIGVNTGKIFGEYEYLHSLGPELFNTPIVISLNWFMLVYITAGFSDRLVNGHIPKIVVGALIMTGYDLIVELTAPAMGMWIFNGGTPPLQNYLAWLILSIIFHAIFRLFKIESEKKLSEMLYLTQLVFLLLVYILLILR
ncbi:MAG: carotenoid biosynthesis protein [Bacteroidales bacterium]